MSEDDPRSPAAHSDPVNGRSAATRLTGGHAENVCQAGADLRRLKMSVVSMTRMDLGRIDWLGRADRIAGAIAEAAVRHHADESFASEGYQLLKAEAFFTALVPAELGGGGAGYAEICHSTRRIGTSCGGPHSPSQCIRTS